MYCGWSFFFVQTASILSIRNHCAIKSGLFLVLSFFDLLSCGTTRLLSTVVCLRRVVFTSDWLDETIVCFLCECLSAETPRVYILSTLPSRALKKKSRNSTERSDSQVFVTQVLLYDTVKTKRPFRKTKLPFLSPEDVIVTASHYMAS